MRHFATEQLRADWLTVINADRAKPDTTDDRNLRQLAKQEATKLMQEIQAQREPVLLINAGLLARYGLMILLENLRDTAGTADGPPLLWVLVPSTNPAGPPTIDGAVISIINSNQMLTLQPRWLMHGTEHQEAV